MREYSGSVSCSTTKRGSMMPDLPPMRSRSVFHDLPYGGLESMKSNSRAGKASAERVEPNWRLSASTPSPFRMRSALLMA